MSQIQQPAWFDDAVAHAPAETRADFIRKTYAHLAGALLAFAAVEFLIFQIAPVEALSQTLLGTQWSWLIVLGVFMVVSWVAHSWAASAISLPLQYAGLGLYIVAQAIIFVPLLWIATTFYPGAIQIAAISTLGIFGALTIVVFMSGKDFSFMRGFLTVAGLAAMVTIVCSIIFGFDLGLLFTVLMIGLMAGYIVYETSNVLHHYQPGQHVAASLALFASVATMFWYVLRLVMALQRD